MHTEIPTPAELDRLIEISEPTPSCVSIYMPTNPVTREAEGDRIAFRNLVSTAVEHLHEGGLERGVPEEIAEALEDLSEDDDFWAVQGNTLAVFVHPTHLRAYRLANHLEESVTVAHRFAIKPLLRALTFPQSAFVLSLAHGSARLVEVNADLPTIEVRVPEMPGDAGRASIGDRSSSSRMQGSEGKNVRLRQYARKVDSALRDVLSGRHRPLILASTPPLDAMFRAANTYPNLAEGEIRGNPEALNDTDLTSEARVVLDAYHEKQLQELRDLYASRESQERSTADLGQIARAVTIGAVDTLLIDIDASVSGSIDENGTLDLDTPGENDTDLTDEIVRRTIATGGRVMAVRAEDLPAPGPANVILRYAV